VQGRSGPEAAEQRAAWSAHQAELLPDGQLLDSLDAVVIEVRARGWNHD